MKAFKVEEQAHFSPVQVVIEVQSLDELKNIHRAYEMFCKSGEAGRDISVTWMGAQWAVLECLYHSLVDDMRRCLPKFRPVPPRQLSQGAEEELNTRRARAQSKNGCKYTPPMLGVANGGAA